MLAFLCCLLGLRVDVGALWFLCIRLVVLIGLAYGCFGLWCFGSSLVGNWCVCFGLVCICYELCFCVGCFRLLFVVLFGRVAVGAFLLPAVVVVIALIRVCLMCFTSGGFGCCFAICYYG